MVPFQLGVAKTSKLLIASVQIALSAQGTEAARHPWHCWVAQGVCDWAINNPPWWIQPFNNALGFVSLIVGMLSIVIGLTSMRVSRRLSRQTGTDLDKFRSEAKSANEALTQTTQELKQVVAPIPVAVRDLHANVQIIHDMSRKPLQNFAEVFCAAYHMIKKAQDEFVYVNFVSKFGYPHIQNQTVHQQYHRARHELGLDDGMFEDHFPDAVNDHFTSLLDKSGKLRTAGMALLDDQELKEKFLVGLAKTSGYANLNIVDALNEEKLSRQELKRHWEFVRIRPGEAVRPLTVQTYLPWQMLITKGPSLRDKTTKYQCLVFLVGNQNVSGDVRQYRPRGYYTEIGDHIDMQREFADWYIRGGKDLKAIA